MFGHYTTGPREVTRWRSIAQGAGAFRSRVRRVRSPHQPGHDERVGRAAMRRPPPPRAAGRGARDRAAALVHAAAASADEEGHQHAAEQHRRARRAASRRPGRARPMTIAACSPRHARASPPPIARSAPRSASRSMASGGSAAISAAAPRTATRDRAHAGGEPRDATRRGGWRAPRRGSVAGAEQKHGGDAEDEGADGEGDADHRIGRGAAS